MGGTLRGLFIISVTFQSVRMYGDTLSEFRKRAVNDVVKPIVLVAGICDNGLSRLLIARLLEASLPAAVLTLSALVRVIYLAVTHRPVIIPHSAPADVLAGAMNTLTLSLYLLPITVLFIVAYSISHAAIVYAVGCITQGVEVTAGSAYLAVQGRWLRWTGIAMRQFWTFFWPMLIAIVLLTVSFAVRGLRGNVIAAGLGVLIFGALAGLGFVYGMINFIRAALAVPAALQEQLGVNASMRRARALVAGRKWRILLALLLVYALQMVASGIQIPLVLLATMTHGGQQILLQTIQIAVQFITAALVAPIASIALCLLYIDERVRREGYDIELLMRQNFTAVSSHSVTATPVE